MKRIDQIQEEILNEIHLLNGDMEKTLLFIIQQGSLLPELEQKHKNENNLIKGCQSKVWLKVEMNDNILFLTGDSNTTITKGLISLLVRIFNEQPVGDVCEASLFFISSSNLNRFVGSYRSNGLAALHKHILDRATVDLRTQ